MCFFVSIFITMFLHEKYRNMFPTAEQHRIVREQREINRKMAEIRDQTFKRFNSDCR